MSAVEGNAGKNARCEFFAVDPVRTLRFAVETHHIIIDELVCGLFKPEGIAYFQRVIGGPKEMGCEAVILGCPEIPLIIEDSNSALPTPDSTRLLARAALRRAMQSAHMLERKEALSCCRTPPCMLTSRRRI
jgi:hypothetical protein